MMFLASQSSIVGGIIGSSASDTTWSTTDKTSGLNLSGGNLTCSSSSGLQGVRGTLAKSTGKRVFEVVVTAINGDQMGIGMLDATETVDDNNPNQKGALYMHVGGGGAHGEIKVGAQSIFTTVQAVSDVIQVAVDFTNHYVYFKLNSTWLNAADPETTTNPVDYFSTSAMYPWAYFLGFGVTGGYTVDFTPASVPSGWVQWDS